MRSALPAANANIQKHTPGSTWSDDPPQTWIRSISKSPHDSSDKCARQGIVRIWRRFRKILPTYLLVSGHWPVGNQREQHPRSTYVEHHDLGSAVQRMNNRLVVYVFSLHPDFLACNSAKSAQVIPCQFIPVSYYSVHRCILHFCIFAFQP